MDILSKTKFNNIPNSWQISRFTEIADLIHGFQFREEHFSEDGEFIVIKIGNLSYDGNIKLDNISRTDCIGIKNFDKFFLKKGDVLMALTGGTLGKLSIFNLEDKKFLQNYRVGKFEPKEESDKRYIYYLLGSNYVQKKIEDNVNEAAQPNFGKQDFDKIYVPLPPLPEQKAIADCLSTWDDAIEKQTKLIAAKEQRKKALMQQLLSGKKRLPGFTEAWKEVSIKEISSKKSSILQSNALVENSGSYKIYGATGVLTFVDFYEEENRYIGIVKDGSGVGNLFLCDGKSSVIATLDKILPKKNIDLDFLYQLFQTLHFGKYIVGGAIPHIYFRDYSNIHVNLPPELEQRAIGEFLKNVDLELNLLRTKLMFLKKQKVALMQQLLTAKVRLVS